MVSKRQEVHKLFSSVMGGESVWRELMRLEKKDTRPSLDGDSYLVDRVAELVLGLWQEDWEHECWDTKNRQKEITKLIKNHPDFLYVCKEDFYSNCAFNEKVEMETDEIENMICGIAEYLGMVDWENACIREDEFSGDLAPELIDLLNTKKPTWLELATQTKESLREDIRYEYTGDPLKPEEMIAKLIYHRLEGPIWEFRGMIGDEIKIKKSQEKQQTLKAEKEKIDNAWDGLLPVGVETISVEQPKQISPSKPPRIKAAHPRPVAPSLSDLRERIKPAEEAALITENSPEL